MFASLGVRAPDPGSSATRGEAGSRAGQPTSPRPRHTPTPDSSASAALALCRTWDAAEHDPQGKAMAADELRALISAAGGSNHVAKFCRKLLDENGSGATPTASAGTTPTLSATDPGNDNDHPEKSKARTSKKIHPVLNPAPQPCPPAGGARG